MTFLRIVGIAILVQIIGVLQADLSYPIVDTGQEGFYNNSAEISEPSDGSGFYGQDASYDGNIPNYTDNGDGTITDNITGLMWMKTPDLDNKQSFFEALNGADTFSLAGYDDWRLPSVKELYSLIDFNGSTFYVYPYIDTSVFDFVWGDESSGERIIDAQYWSSTEYVGLTMGGDATVFGVNFADGRIKGYPRDERPGGSIFTAFTRYVRDNPEYGINNFSDNGNGTVTDSATGLTWQKSDDGTTRNWENALVYCENLELAGFDDWRLPTAKELQSIVDYTRAPDAITGTVECAIDPIFNVSNDESWYWSSTTHLDGPDAAWACYICFGQAYGYFVPPGSSDDPTYLNVHGAGAQRSDPKDGDPSDYPEGHGPQGDEVRVLNYVRAVRGGLSTEMVLNSNTKPSLLIIGNLSPNPFNGSTNIDITLDKQSHVKVDLFDINGNYIANITNSLLAEGTHQITIDIDSNNHSVSSGIYFCNIDLNNNQYFVSKKLLYIK